MGADFFSKNYDFGKAEILTAAISFFYDEDCKLPIWTSFGLSK